MTVRTSQKPSREILLLLVSLLVVGGICVPIYRWTQTAGPPLDSEGKWTPQRLGRLLFGPEQIACYCFFTWASLILGRRALEVARQRTAFQLDLLPTDDADRGSYWDATALSYDYTVEVYALSEGWEGAKGRASFEAATAHWEAILMPETEFGETGTVYRYRVRLTDRRTGEPVQASLQWQAVLKLQAGSRMRVAAQHQGALQTNAQGVAEFQFTPDLSGDWEVSITGRDMDGNRFQTRHYLWLSGQGYTPWWARRQDANALEVRLQKRAYEVGEPVEVAIRTPHRDAAFYITVEGDRLYHSQVVRAQGALTRVRLPAATREQIPNAFVSVCMVRNKELVRREVEYRVGKGHGALQVQAQPDKPRYAPGETMLVRLQTADMRYNKIAAFNF